MKILITGGAGFIGSTIAGLYLDRGDQVTIVDNLSTGKKENISNLQGGDRVNFYQADICNWPELEDAVQDSDRIYHMAAMVGQKLVLPHPVEVLERNIAGCQRLLKAVATAPNGPGLLIASSSEIEREPSPHLSQVTYPLSKQVNESMALAYVHTYNAHVVIARLFNVIGPRQTGAHGMVVPNFIEQAVRNEPITIYGDGKQTRSFCDVRDTVQALHLLLETPAARGEVIPVGNDHEITIQELAEKIKERTQSSSPLTYMPYEEAYGQPFQDVLKRRPDLTKLVGLTGYRPQYALNDSIDSIINSL